MRPLVLLFIFSTLVHPVLWADPPEACPPSSFATASVAGPYGLELSQPSCAPYNSAISAAWARAVPQAGSCLSTTNLTLALKMLMHLASKRVEVECLDATQFDKKREALNEEQSSDPARGPQKAGAHDCALGVVKGTRIYLSPAAFIPARCGSLESTLFHELLHNMGVHPSHGHSPSDATDPVYGCELACFGTAPIDPRRGVACSGASN